MDSKRRCLELSVGRIRARKKEGTYDAFKGHLSSESEQVTVCGDGRKGVVSLSLWTSWPSNSICPSSAMLLTCVPAQGHMSTLSPI